MAFEESTTDQGLFDGEKQRKMDEYRKPFLVRVRQARYAEFLSGEDTQKGEIMMMAKLPNGDMKLVELKEDYDRRD